MRNIMTKMIENYQKEVADLKEQIKAKRITNPSHTLNQRLNWVLAKWEAVSEVLLEFDKKNLTKMIEIQNANNIIDKMLSKGYNKQQILEAVYKTGIPQGTALRLFLQKRSRLSAETPEQRPEAHSDNVGKSESLLLVLL